MSNEERDDGGFYVCGGVDWSNEQRRKKPQGGGAMKVNGSALDMRHEKGRDDCYQADGKHTMPYEIEWYCPICKAFNGWDDYLKHPTLNGKNTINTECGECEAETVLTFMLYLVPESVQAETKEAGR